MRNEENIGHIVRDKRAITKCETNILLNLRIKKVNKLNKWKFKYKLNIKQVSSVKTTC